MVTVIHGTGEIVEDEYVDIEAAEAELFRSVDDEIAGKLHQVKVLLTISKKQLYRQRLDPDGEPFASMNSYLKSIAPQLKARSGSKVRSILSWMTRVRIYEDQLGKDDSWLLSMASHAEALLPAANRHLPTSQLLDDDAPTPEGGRRLGREVFISLVEEIEQHVFDAQSGIPETSWEVSDTKERVAEITGRSDEKVRVTMVAHLVGNKVKIDKMNWLIADYCYSPDDPIDLEHFRKIARGVAIDGLPDDWRR